MASRRKTDAVRWFRQAGYDLKAARWNIQGSSCSSACFLVQQAGKKALKSLLYYLGARRSALCPHSLVEMIQEAGKKMESLKELLEEARELDLHDIPSRYPNGLPGGYPHQFYGKETAEKAAEAADKILTAMTSYYRTAGEMDILTESDKG
jgi:HEPN domain-containing protein